MEIRSDSTEYAVATVSADHDLTDTSIDVALPSTGTDPVEWHAAEIQQVTVDTDDHSTVVYRLLLGPSDIGSVVLAEGTYDWIVRVTDAPEVVIRKAGTITVT